MHFLSSIGISTATYFGIKIIDAVYMTHYMSFQILRNRGRCNL